MRLHAAAATAATRSEMGHMVTPSHQGMEQQRALQASPCTHLPGSRRGPPAPEGTGPAGAPRRAAQPPCRLRNARMPPILAAHTGFRGLQVKRCAASGSGGKQQAPAGNRSPGGGSRPQAAVRRRQAAAVRARPPGRRGAPDAQKVRRKWRVQAARREPRPGQAKLPRPRRALTGSLVAVYTGFNCLSGVGLCRELGGKAPSCSYSSARSSCKARLSRDRARLASSEDVQELGGSTAGEQQGAHGVGGTRHGGGRRRHRRLEAALAGATSQQPYL